MKYQRRREILKKGKDPFIQLARKWKKASTLAKVGIGVAAIAPKAILVGAGYWITGSIYPKTNLTASNSLS